MIIHRKSARIINFSFKKNVGMIMLRLRIKDILNTLINRKI